MFCIQVSTGGYVTVDLGQYALYDYIYDENTALFFDEMVDLPVVVAFLSNVDPTANDGQVFFRETMDQDILDRATRDLEDGTGFIATWVFIATWHQVTYSEGNATSPVRTAMFGNTYVP